MFSGIDWLRLMVRFFALLQSSYHGWWFRDASTTIGSFVPSEIVFAAKPASPDLSELGECEAA
jgi:hypothetical protein